MPDASFLIEKFTILGFEFQYWMVIVAVGLVLYSVFIVMKQDGNGPR